MITPSEYKFISDSLGDARRDSKKTIEHLKSMRTHLNISEIPNETIDKIKLFNFIDSVYELTTQKYRDPNPSMTNFVNRLQTHIEHHYDSVDDFLKNNDIKVMQDFADLSFLVGFEIDEANIE
jgi:broad specificity polyphosphatase/5'/3'-nucleotidase SurE